MIRLTLTLFAIAVTPAQASEESFPPVWSQDKTAVAICEYNESSVCYVVCNDKVVNVSMVEKANLGKIGHYAYEKVITYPVSWESKSKSHCMFWFQTNAWINGQRHTVKEPVSVHDGEYRGR